MSHARYRTWRIGLALLLLANAWMCAAQSAEIAPPEIAVLRAPQGAPNVLVVLLDDVGFGAASTFGGPIDTPALEALANAGLRYNRFHTTAICSPTRASLLTGRDAHVTGVGTVMNVANSYPGYTGVLKKETATIARILRGNGYNTAAFGKWHLAPDWEISPSGPFDHWPTEAVNNLLKRVKRAAFGFTSFRNYRIRTLLYAGKPNWDLLATITPR